MKHKAYVIYFATYVIIPLIAIELFAQFRFKSGYIFDVFINNGIDKSSIAENGFLAPNMSLSYKYKTIYPDHQELKSVTINTDEFGTIEPSSLRAHAKKIDESVLFCGGSTTESLVVEEGKRPPDIFSSISNIPSINAGKSGKDLTGCIKSIEFILRNIGKPRMIVVANNVNTLSEYAELKASQKFSIDSAKEKNSSKALKALNLFLPGIYASLKHIKHNQLVTRNTDLTPYEVALKQGCCHGASRLNKDNEGLRFDWNDITNIRDYYRFVSIHGYSLEATLSKYGFEKGNVVIFIEPHSFSNSGTSGVFDFRQYLYNVEGGLLSGLDSASITNRYDNEYKLALESVGFKTLEVDPLDLLDEYFYDAVHLSPAGSEFIGKFYAANLKKMLE